MLLCVSCCEALEGRQVSAIQLRLRGKDDMKWTSYDMWGRRGMTYYVRYKSVIRVGVGEQDANGQK